MSLFPDRLDDPHRCDEPSEITLRTQPSEPEQITQSLMQRLQDSSAISMRRNARIG